jgi:hypothetical protein
VLFSLIPFVVPPSPTKCLAQAATLFLCKVDENKFRHQHLQKNFGLKRTELKPHLLKN